METYLDSLLKEAQTYAGERIASIYVGGGTPSLMNEQQWEMLFKLIRNVFVPDENVEWTVESNPESLSSGKLKLLKSNGVNRISLGVQSLNDRYLKYLGRNHNAKSAVDAFHKISETGFDNISLDLMFSFPGQTSQESREDVRAVVALGGDHLSLYALTIEEKSRFFTKNVTLQNDDVLAAQYSDILEWLAEEGFEQYEVSNFAREGKQSRHNRNYWQGGNYIGLGIGAHSHRDGTRYWNVSHLMRYIDLAQSGQSVVEGEERLSQRQRFMEVFLFGLRMNEGVSLEELQSVYQYTLSPGERTLINQFVKSRFFAWKDNRLAATKSGRLILDEISARFI